MRSAVSWELMQHLDTLRLQGFDQVRSVSLVSRVIELEQALAVALKRIAELERSQ